MPQPNNDDTTASPPPNPDADQPTCAYATVPPDDADQQQNRSPIDGIPKSFGRYRVVALLGKGGFGQVYRAVDEQLDRQVAVKVTLGSLIDPSIRQGFLTEARIVAALDHPHIVPVFDVGQTDGGDFYVVSKLIDGSDLAGRMKIDRPDRLLALRLVESIADALQYAHSRGLVHRDIKPANILLDRSDRPYLTDFGIALRESDRAMPGASAGTPAYMSPEQARGEGHRIDHRSDIYSLGVVLYELLTGRRPFRSDNLVHLMKLIATEEVRSPRVFDHTLPMDLDRICMKALARRPSDRFSIASDFAEEVHWILNNNAPTPSAPSTLRVSSPVQGPGTETPPSPLTPHSSQFAVGVDDSKPTAPTRVVPKGLRSFEASDSSFFLELLPGPFDRDGLPEGLRFWKTKIEQTDKEKTFSVGLVYGPSGCGKSSMMKAGLLPRLSPAIIPVYVEATPDDTEGRLLRAVRKAIPDAEGDTLREVLSNIRRRRLVPSKGKLLLIIDQFEQWLHAETDYAKAPLTEALLQCDGETVQAILMVRDDFWISVSRFLRELDVPILERENSAMVDLFDMEHATKVLGLFGKAYGKLADSSKEWTEDQNEFIRQAVAGLAQERKVISVRIAVFADMMKSRDWTTAALNEVGGTEGVGVTFLEEMFGSRHAPIQHRQHQEAVRGLLEALLPAASTDIKGSMQSAASLQKAAGYEQNPQAFHELMEILDKNLRLITPIDAADSRTIVPNSSAPSSNRRTIVINRSDPTSPIDSRERLEHSLYYQLTHDYLVPSLREWLTRKQRETKKGRAELKLAERAAVWSAKPENKQLPTLVEWFQIRRLTDKKRWTVPERSLMRTAARVHLRNWGNSIVAVLILGGIIGYLFQQQSLRSQQEKITVALDSLQKTLGPAVPVNIERLIDMKRPDLIRSELERRYATASETREKLSLAFALAQFGRVDSEYMVSQIDAIEDRDTANLIDSLRQDPHGSLEMLTEAAAQCTTHDLYRRKARLALAAMAIGDTALPIDACEFEGRTDHGVRTWFIDEFPRWKFDRERLVATVKVSASPALRSAVCLGLGQSPVKQISAVEKALIVELATKWYSLSDSSTHSAVAWLIRQLELEEPKVSEAKQIVEDRTWFVNSQGVTFVLVTPPPIEREPLPDPLEKFRQDLDRFEKATQEEKMLTNYRYLRAEALLVLGKYVPALADLDALRAIQNESGEDWGGGVELLRLLALARLKNTAEAEAALAEWISKSSDYRRFRRHECLVLLWLGRKEAAVERFEEAFSNAEWRHENERFELACVSAVFAGNETESTQEKQVWTDRSLKLLENCRLSDEGWRENIRSDPDLQLLHNDSRFVKLASERWNVPGRQYWLANREVTRGEFDSFMNDTSYDGEKPVDRDESELWNYAETSPTLDHPAQRVNWFDAVKYCNWLSWREGLEPAYRFLGNRKVRLSHSEGEETMEKWELDAKSNGYRLPSDVEWAHACRAGTSTKWSMGNERSLITAYCQMYPSKVTSICGEKLPNVWGFHDINGNVSELSHNRLGWPFGGSYQETADMCTEEIHTGYHPKGRDRSTGFRLARNSGVDLGVPKDVDPQSGR